MSDIMGRAEEMAINWARDKQTLDMLPDMPIVEMARKWHQMCLQQADYVTRLEAAYLAARRTIEWDAIDRDELNRHYTNISAPWMDAKTKGDLIEQRISKSLGRIKRGEQE